MSAVAAAASGGLEWQLFHSHVLSLLAMVMLYLVACNSKNIFLCFSNSKTFERRFKHKNKLTRKGHQTWVRHFNKNWINEK
jgi:hypothetical protein